MSDESRAELEQVVERLRAALRALFAGNADAVKALCSRRDDATAFLGMGGYEQGWAQFERRWEWAAGQFRGAGEHTYEVLSLVATSELACTAEIERTQIQRDGLDAPIELATRITHVFCREDDGWKLLHRHASRLNAQSPTDAR